MVELHGLMLVEYISIVYGTVVEINIQKNLQLKVLKIQILAV